MPADAQGVASQWVADGDTLRLRDGRRVRLIGINAPELGHNGQSAEPYAQAARQQLQALVQDQSLYLVTGAAATDRYGRTLGYLFDERGRNLAAQLLAKGMGYAVALAPNVALASCHAAAEQRARDAGRGLWTQPPIMAVTELDQGGFYLLRGTISAVERAGGALWVTLQGPLAVRFIAADYQAVAPLPDATWVGAEVELRGWVIDRQQWGDRRPGYRRFMLNVSHPLHIRRL